VHELSITQKIVSIVSEHAQGAPVKRVSLEIGKLSAVAPDAIRFCFDVCSKGTEMEQAELEIIETPGRGRCRDCGREIKMDDCLEPCACGSHRIEWTGGRELHIKELELV
jgi:hydrogenase nickel incorporation protein HypA/HybF